MRTSLWKHQREAIAFAATRPGILIAHDMGCGKTATAIAICEGEQARRVLVICPLSVVGVWPSQVERHSSMAYRVIRLDKGSVAQKTQAAKSLLNTAQPCIVVINHESAWREPFREFAYREKWEVVIVDEAHRLKAAGGKFSRFAAGLAARCAVRVALTGTPMPHSPLDIYGLCRFVDSTVFGTSSAVFRARFAIMGGYQGHEVVGYQNMDILEKRLATVMHMVKKKDVLDLPPEVDETRFCELEPAARKVYAQLKKQFVAGVQGGVITAANALTVLLRLQQITGGSVRDEESGKEIVISESKRRLLKETIEDVGDLPVVVFCRFRSDLQVVREVAISLARTYGEVSGASKNALTSAGTLDPSVRVCGVQIQAGGVGIDLSLASTAIYYSLGFSLGDVLQARARLHRPGQTKTVTHIHLVAEGTVDEAILRALEARKDLVEEVLDECKKRQEGL